VWRCFSRIIAFQLAESTAGALAVLVDVASGESPEFSGELLRDA
jgi:hypothetical protein